MIEQDLIQEQKEQQRIEDNYWGKGSEPIERIKKRIDDGNTTY